MFTMGLAMLLDFTVVLYIQDNVGWRWGFGIPAIGMLISIVLFLVGYSIYMLLKLAHSCGSRRSSLPRSGSDQKRRDESRGESDRERRRCAHIYIQERSICQLLVDGKLGWGTIEECFF